MDALNDCFLAPNDGIAEQIPCTGAADDDAPKILQHNFTLRVMDTSEHPSAALRTEILKVKAKIRSHPTVPANPANLSEPQPEVFDDSVAVQLPRKYCAFSGCQWPDTSADAGSDLGTVQLLTHIMKEHAKDLEDAVALLPECYPPEVRYMSIYNEAFAEKIREGAPLASYSIDRRALTQFSEALQDRSVSAPMRFLRG